MTNSYNKGRKFEQETARLLTITTSVPWKRVPNSGGLSNHRSHPLFHGDIYPESELFNHIHVECKHWKTLTIGELYSPKSRLHKTINKLKQHQDWILFMRVNNAGTYTITKDGYLNVMLNIKGKDMILPGGYVMRKVEL